MGLYRAIQREREGDKRNPRNELARGGSRAGAPEWDMGSKFQCVGIFLRTGAMAMLCTTETQIEEIWKKEKPEAQAEAKGNIEKQHPKKSITM